MGLRGLYSSATWVSVRPSGARVVTDQGWTRPDGRVVGPCCLTFTASTHLCRDSTCQGAQAPSSPPSLTRTVVAGGITAGQICHAVLRSASAASPPDTMQVRTGAVPLPSRRHPQSRRKAGSARWPSLASSASTGALRCLQPAAGRPQRSAAAGRTRWRPGRHRQLARQRQGPKRPHQPGATRAVAQWPGWRGQARQGPARQPTAARQGGAGGGKDKDDAFWRHARSKPFHNRALLDA